MLIHLLLLLQLCFYRIECDYWTRSNISKRVIGGYTAFKGEFPYQVAVLHVTDGLICGGSIITKKWVLSAAHCFDRYISSDDFRVLVGAINPTSGQLYDVLKIIQHENYERYALENDIALLMTVSEIRFHSNVNRIVLEKCYIRAVPCITLGWGKCNFRVARPLPKLRVLEMKTIPNKRCSKFFSVVSEMEIGMCQLCAIPRDRKKGLCFLDSGSPLVHKGKQIGILTSGTMCGKFPSVFTRISSFFHWISTTLKENRPDSSKSAHSSKNYTNERHF